MRGSYALMRSSSALAWIALVLIVAACSSSTPKEVQSPSVTQSATESAPVIGLKMEQSGIGMILTDQNGRTLYAFTIDKGGKSSCTDVCIATWPALLSRQDTAVGDGVDKALLSSIDRAEGASQITYNKWPLYYYVGDVGPGDIDGQGIDNVWFVLGANGKLIRNTA
jgi:predicted lipoprotein with Yx(FWY)xxD motif